MRPTCSTRASSRTDFKAKEKPCLKNKNKTNKKTKARGEGYLPDIIGSEDYAASLGEGFLVHTFRKGPGSFRRSSYKALNGVCEQSATDLLMVKWTCCFPGAGMEIIALRAGSKHTSTMLNYTEPKGKEALVLDILAYHF